MGPGRLVAWAGALLAAGALLPACTENNLQEVPPDIEVGPASIVFGTVTVGVHGEAELLIRNVGDGTLHVSSVHLQYPEREEFGIESFAGDLLAGDSSSVTVTFDPADLGPRENLAVIESDDPDEPVVEVPIEVADVVPEPVAGVEVDPLSLDWGALPAGASEPRTVIIRSVGSGTLHLSDLSLTAGTSLDFSLSSDPSPAELEPGQEVTATVTFTPTDDLDDTGLLQVTTDDPDSPVIDVSLSGTRVTVPDIEVAPGTLDFGALAMGATATLFADVRNVGSADLTLGTLALSGSPSYQLTTDPSGLVLTPGDYTQVGVTLTIDATGAHTGLVTVPSDDPDEDPAYINLQGLYDAVPEIDVDPLVVDFGSLPHGSTVSQQVHVSNIGGDDLDVSSLTLVGSGDFTFSAAGLPGILPPGGTVNVTVSYHVSDDVPDSGTLTVASDDGDEPAVDVTLLGAAELLPDIEVDPAALDFGLVPLDATSTLAVTVRNVGDADLTLGTLAVAGAMFDLAVDASGAVLLPGDSTLVQVAYTPSTESDHTGTLTLPSNDPDEPVVVVPLNGSGEELNDPPVADAGPDREEIPLDTIALDGSGSYDPNGDTPLTYQWTLVSAPAGSTTSLTGATSVNPSMYLDLAGTYVVGLVVTDTTGMHSVQDQAIIEVIPWQDVHVQLTWDSYGQDLDLHVAQAGHEIYKQPYDCNYCNPNPNWGGGGSDDDPSLDIDNLEGYGPENINIVAPANGDYSLYVVYYGKWTGYASSVNCGGDCPDTNATLRLYLNGILVYSDTRLMSTTKQVWYVGDVDWPTGVFTAVDSVTNTSRTTCF